MSQQFVVRMNNGYALQFVQNLCMKVFNLAADEEATKFPSRNIADETARNYGLQWGQYKVEEVGTNSTN